jgi:hypothetical protein
VRRHPADVVAIDGRRRARKDVRRHDVAS